MERSYATFTEQARQALQASGLDETRVEEGANIFEATLDAEIFASALRQREFPSEVVTSLVAILHQKLAQMAADKAWDDGLDRLLDNMRQQQPPEQLGQLPQEGLPVPYALQQPIAPALNAAGTALEAPRFDASVQPLSVPIVAHPFIPHNTSEIQTFYRLPQNRLRAANVETHGPEAAVHAVSLPTPEGATPLTPLIMANMPEASMPAEPTFGTESLSAGTALPTMAAGSDSGPSIGGVASGMGGSMGAGAGPSM